MSSIILVMLIITLNMQSTIGSYTYYVINVEVQASFPNGTFYPWIINPIMPFQNISNDYLTQIAYVNLFEFNINGKSLNDYSVTYDQDNNTIINANVPQINQSINMIFNISYVIYRENKRIPNISLDMSGGLSDIPNRLLSNVYLGFNDAWLNDSRIRSIAISMLNKSNVLDTVLKYVEWIDKNILYPVNPSHLQPWNATSVFEYKEGDCDDRAILLISMLRSVGIPSYLQVGAIYMNSSDTTESWNNLHYRLINIGWHAWAMVYIPPWGWLPVDLTYFKNALVSNVHINNSTYMRITANNLLDHIIGSALFTSTVFIIGSVITSDYIKPSVRWFDTVLKNGIVWKETDKIISVTITKQTPATVRQPSYNWNIFLLALFVVAVFTYAIIRKSFRRVY